MCRFTLILRAFSHFMFSINPPLNQKSGGFYSRNHLLKSSVHHIKQLLWFIVLYLCIDVHSCFAVFVSGKVLNRFGVYSRIKQVCDVSVPQLVWGHIKIYCVLNVGIVLLLHAQRRFHTIFNALSVHIFIIAYLGTSIVPTILACMLHFSYCLLAHDFFKANSFIKEKTKVTSRTITLVEA